MDGEVKKEVMTLFVAKKKLTLKSKLPAGTHILALFIKIGKLFFFTLF